MATKKRRPEQRWQDVLVKLLDAVRASIPRVQRQLLLDPTWLILAAEIACRLGGRAFR